MNFLQSLMMAVPFALVWGAASASDPLVGLPNLAPEVLIEPVGSLDALRFPPDLIVANCRDFSRIAHRLEKSTNLREQAALTAIDVWCGDVPSLRLSADLQREPSTALFYAIRTWRLAATHRNPNAELNTRLVQTWFAKNADSEWAISHFERGGGEESATMMAASGLNSLHDMDAILEFPDVTPRLKAWLSLSLEMRYSLKPRPPWVNLPEM
jgi:hypothetical protein